MLSGQKGLARFAKDKLLTDDNKDLKYICTDPSRQIFKYKDNSGKIIKDVEAKKLTTYIIEGGIKQKISDVATTWCNNNNGHIDSEKFNIIATHHSDINKIEDDNNTFKKELITITSK